MAVDKMMVDSVAEPGPQWMAMAPDLELIRDLMGGTRAMRGAGLRWLPKENSESWDAWRARLNRSVLFNGLARTVAALAGRPFCHDVMLEGAHPALQKLTTNIDGRGGSLTTFAGNLLRLMLRDGAAYILVDVMPDGGLPYFVLVEAAQMIGIRRGRVDGQSGIIQARIRERTIKRKAQFRDDWVDLIRVLEAGRWTLYRQDEGVRGGWSHINEGRMGIDRVPLVECAVYPDHMMVAAPPLIDLAWLNVAHWQSSSDQRHILHIARVPILFARGMDASEGKFDIGPNRLILAEDATADMKFVEHSGAAIEAGRQDLLDLEEKMAVMGLDLMARRPGNPTATARAIDRAQNNAFLNMLVDDVRDHLAAAMRLAATWLKLPEDAAGRVILPKYFPIDPATSDAAGQLLEEREQGGISAQDFLHTIERKGLMPATL